MPFTGRLGTQNSDLGNIVLGIPDSFSIIYFGFNAHVLTSKKIRIKFDHAVTEDSATIISNYTLASTVTPGTAIVPNIIAITFYNEDRKSIVVTLDADLTYNIQYSITISGVVDDFGEPVSPIPVDFIANVQNPPRILGAYLSERGFIDVLFDRAVGPTSSGATATIQGANVGTPSVLFPVPWIPSLPETTLRFQLQLEMVSDTGYIINVSNFVDSSLNINSSSIGLDLVLRAPTPYNYFILTQLQIIDAYVADVSNDLIDTATVRIYFNCNINYLQSINTGNWTVSLQSGHKNLDYINNIVSANPVDLPSLLILVNELKAKINGHEVGAEIHYIDDVFNPIISPNATDLPSALTLINDIQISYLDHLIEKGVHSYPDTINTFAFISASDLGAAITAAITVKTDYNNHLANLYPTIFSIAYNTTPIGSIFPFASVSNSYKNVALDTGPYNYFVDLHVICPTNSANIVITAALTSEDGGSSTNISDYTGSIIARSANTQAQILSNYFFTDSFLSLQSDREVSFYESPLIINQSLQKSSGNITRTSTLPRVLWLINQLMFAYTKHIDQIFGAGHQIVDTVNIIVNSEYPTRIDLNLLIIAANTLKVRFNDHASSGLFHFNADNFLITAPNAFDFSSLVFLVENILNVFLHHNASGSSSRVEGLSPQFPGIHSYPGFRIMSASLYNIFKIVPEFMQDGASYVCEIPVINSYYDNFENLVVINNQIYVNNFIAISTRPSLASAIPIIGYNPLDPGPILNTDRIEVFFSKSMYQETLDSTNLILTGGTITPDSYNWTGDSTIEICISNMTTIPYSLQVVGLTDLNNNPIY